MHDIDYYKKMAFDPRQMQIIRDGLNAGFDVDWYANTSFDYLQMEQIYLALKAGFDDDSLNMLCDPRIPYDSMNQMRESISEQLGLYEKAAEDIKKKKTIRYVITAAFITILLAVFSIVYINRETISYYFEDIELTLKHDKIKLGLSQAFVASDYINKYDKECKLTLPKQKSFDNVGTYTVTYKLSNKVKSVTKDLIIDVYDDIPPVIELENDSVTLDYGSQFNAGDYIKSATDNIDGDVKNSVQWNSIDTSISGTFTVTYTVKDASDNEGTSSMIVHINEKKSDNTNSNKSNNQNSNTNKSGSSSQSTPSKNASSYNRFFEGYSIDSYNAACDYADGLKNSGKISGYSVTPTGEGVQVTCY